MKRIFTFLLGTALLLCAAGCQCASPAVTVFKKPPEGKLITSDGGAPLRTGGYSWSYRKNGGMMEAIVADQACRPLTADVLKPVTISSNYAETVHAYVPETGKFEPTNSLGYLVNAEWEVAPTSVSYTCWQDTVWQNSDTPEQTVVPYEDTAFYAKPGGYIYEIVATWEDTGAGYYGTANYYVYIVAGDEHSHQIATEAQVVDNPVTGYCGNIQTTLHIGEKSYTFMYGHSVNLTDILINLDYDPDKVCKCMAEYTVDTEFDTGYGVNLSQGYARCEKGQADLTQEQINQISEIIEWAETTNCKYPINN